MTAPTKHAKDLHRERMHFLMTKEERRRLERVAKAWDLSLSAVIRTLVKREDHNLFGSSGK